MKSPLKSFWLENVSGLTKVRKDTRLAGSWHLQRVSSRDRGERKEKRGKRNKEERQRKEDKGGRRKEEVEKKEEKKRKKERKKERKKKRGN